MRTLHQRSKPAVTGLRREVEVPSVVPTSCHRLPSDLNDPLFSIAGGVMRVVTTSTHLRFRQAGIACFQSAGTFRSAACATATSARSTGPTDVDPSKRPQQRLTNCFVRAASARRRLQIRRRRDGGAAQVLATGNTILRWHRDLLGRRHAAISRPGRRGRPRTLHSIRAPGTAVGAGEQQLGIPAGARRTAHARDQGRRVHCLGDPGAT